MTVVGDLLSEFKERPAPGEDLPVLTLTERNGFVRQADRFKKRLATEDTSAYKVVRFNDLAFNPYLLWAGAVAQNTVIAAGVISPLYPTFRVRDGYDPRYVAKMLLSPAMISAYDTIAFGSVPRRRRSSVSDFLALPVAEVPPLPEQRRIAAILDRVDSIRSSRKLALSLLESLAGSHFVATFGNSSLKPVTISSFAKVRSGSTPPRADSENFGGSTPWVKTGEVNGGVITSTAEHVTAAGIHAARLRTFPIRSIVVAMYGQGATRGKSAVLGIAATTNQACAVIEPNQAFVPEFLQTQLALSYERLRGAAVGGNQPNLSRDRIETFEVLLPPIREQEQFASTIASIAESAGKLRRSLELLEEWFIVLQSRAFRGEL